MLSPVRVARVGCDITHSDWFCNRDGSGTTAGDTGAPTGNRRLPCLGGRPVLSIWGEPRAQCPRCPTERYGGAVMVHHVDLIDAFTHDPATFLLTARRLAIACAQHQEVAPITPTSTASIRAPRILLPSARRSYRCVGGRPSGATAAGSRGRRGRPSSPPPTSTRQSFPTQPRVAAGLLRWSTRALSGSWVRRSHAHVMSTQAARDRSDAPSSGLSRVPPGSTAPRQPRRRVLSVWSHRSSAGRPVSARDAAGRRNLLVVAGSDTPWSALVNRPLAPGDPPEIFATGRRPALTRPPSKSSPWRL